MSLTSRVCKRMEPPKLDHLNDHVIYEIYKEKYSRDVRMVGKEGNIPAVDNWIGDEPVPRVEPPSEEYPRKPQEDAGLSGNSKSKCSIKSVERPHNTIVMRRRSRTRAGTARIL